MQSFISRFTFLLKFIFILLKTGSFQRAYIFGALKGGSNGQMINQFLLDGEFLVHRSSKRKIRSSDTAIFDNDISSILLAFEKFALDEDSGKILVHLNKHGKEVKLLLTNQDNWNAFNEILVLDGYEVYVANQLVVIDVGMNVGTAALFFASMDNVTKVYGYEPSPASCLLAKENFALNELGSKIEFACAALGKGEKTVQIPKSQSGSVGTTVTDFVMEKLYKSTDFNSIIDITVKDAATVIGKIINENKEKILLKLDCEGAEYEIIDDLFAKDLLRKISVVIIEWHYKGKEALCEKLVQSGFSLFMPDHPVAIPVGFIYGINNHLLLERE